MDLVKAYLATETIFHHDDGNSYSIVPSQIVSQTPASGTVIETLGLVGAYIITASNPFSQPLSASENNKRNESLVADLKHLSLAHTECICSDRLATWAETSYLVPMPQGFETWEFDELMYLLGDKYDQNALFRFEDQTTRSVVLLDNDLSTYTSPYYVYAIEIDDEIIF